MKLCDRCRVAGCLLNYGGKACKNARKQNCPDVVFTNADRVREMNDEELAKFMLSNDGAAYCKNNDRDSTCYLKGRDGMTACELYALVYRTDQEPRDGSQRHRLGTIFELPYRTGQVPSRLFPVRNNKSMSPAIRAQITAELGVEPVLINSALVSAQNRQRLYWVGKREPDGTYSQVRVEQPEDRGILLRGILESGVCWREKGYALTASNHSATAEDMIARRQRNGAAEPIRIGTIENDAKKQDFDSQQYRVYSPDGKSVTLCGNGEGVGAKTGLYAVPVPVNETVEGKAQCLRATYYKDGIRNMVGNTVDRKTCVAMPVGMAAGPKSILVVTDAGKSVPVYEVRNGKIAIKGKEYPIKLTDGFYIIRKLTVTECKRLQTVPDTYTFPVSDTQAYKMLGNGWTVDVIAHIMSHFDGLTEEPVEVLSMYDGMSCGHIALDKLGVDVTAYYATEIDKYAIQTTQHNFPDTVQLGDAFQVRDEEWRPRRAEEAE